MQGHRGSSQFGSRSRSKSLFRKLFLRGNRVRKSPGFGSWVALTAFLSVVLSSVALLGGYQVFRAEFPDVSELNRRFPAVIYHGRGKPFEVTLRNQRPAGWTPLSQISRVAIGAVIVSEDWSFYSHKGYDAAAIREAIVEDLEKGSFVRGASTLTQQVAKNVFLEQDKTLWRKVREFWIALELEEKVGKRRILESYFNIAEWGEGIFGIRAAARHYFGKSPKELSAREGAFLAMLLPSPKKYSVSHRQGGLTRYARRTVSSILFKMSKARYISQSEYEEALNHRMAFERSIAMSNDGPGEDETDEQPVGPDAGSEGAPDSDGAIDRSSETASEGKEVETSAEAAGDVDHERQMGKPSDL